MNYASFLAAQQRTADAREWAERVLAKKPTMPRYLQRRERPWFRKASALLIGEGHRTGLGEGTITCGVLRAGRRHHRRCNRNEESAAAANRAKAQEASSGSRRWADSGLQ